MLGPRAAIRPLIIATAGVLALATLPAGAAAAISAQAAPCSPSHADTLPAPA